MPCTIPARRIERGTTESLITASHRARLNSAYPFSRQFTRGPDSFASGHQATGFDRQPRSYRFVFFFFFFFFCSVHVPLGGLRHSLAAHRCRPGPCRRAGGHHFLATVFPHGDTGPCSASAHRRSILFRRRFDGRAAVPPVPPSTPAYGARPTARSLNSSRPAVRPAYGALTSRLDLSAGLRVRPLLVCHRQSALAWCGLPADVASFSRHSHADHYPSRRRDRHSFAGVSADCSLYAAR